jgi:hypothetical protein
MHVGFSLLILSVGEADSAESVLLIEGSGTRIPLKRRKCNILGTQATGLVQQGQPDALALTVRVKVQVIEVFAIDEHIADHSAGLSGYPPCRWPVADTTGEPRPYLVVAVRPNEIRHGDLSGVKWISAIAAASSGIASKISMVGFIALSWPECRA